MHVIRACITLVAASFLVLSSNAGAAEVSPQTKKKVYDATKACQKAECKSMKGKDNEAYEQCMMKCREAHGKDKIGEDKMLVPLMKK